MRKLVEQLATAVTVTFTIFVIGFGVFVKYI